MTENSRNPQTLAKAQLELGRIVALIVVGNRKAARKALTALMNVIESYMPGNDAEAILRLAIENDAKEYISFLAA